MLLFINWYNIYLNIIKLQIFNLSGCHILKIVFVIVCKKQPFIWDLISSNSNRCARARHTNIHCKRKLSRIAASFQTLVSENVFIFILERKLKKKKDSLLCFGTLPVSALMERQAPCSLPGAAAGFQSRGYNPTWKKAAGILLGLVLVLLSCLSVPPRMGVLCQRGQKICFEMCCLATPHGWLWVLFRTFLYPSFLPALMMSSLLNHQLTGAGLSTSALEVHHLVLSEGKTEGLYCNIICHITAS